MTRRARWGRLAVTAFAVGVLGAAAAVAGAQDAPPYALPPEPGPPPASGGGQAPASGPRKLRLTRVAGTVRFAPPGAARHRVLERPARVPYGTRVSTTYGRVRIDAAAGGKRWRSDFYGGRFRLVGGGEPTGPLVTLELIGGSFAGTCGQARATARAAARRKKRRVRRLWGDGKGRFRTRGRYSAATVRGTKWLVEDRCDSTVTRVARGEVEVEDFTEEPFPYGGPEDGEGPDRLPAPAAGGAPAEGGARVRVRRGGSYSARPRD